MHYDLKDLKLFLAIVQAQNLSAGAAATHMTASSASYRLKNLEYTVGGELFVRTSKGMTPTPAGEVLARHAKKLLAGVEAMHTELSDYSSNLRGSIRVLANSSSLNGFLIPSLARFLTGNTGINVDLKEHESLKISSAIEEGVADIGIGADLEPLPSLERLLYAHDRLVCVVPPSHPLASAPRVSFEEILDHDLVSVQRASSNFLFLSNQARLAGKTMRVRVHVHNFDASLYMIEAGVGVAIVPASIAGKATMQGRLIALPITDPWAERTLHLVRRVEAGDQQNLVRQFSDILLNDPLVAEARRA
ncbi:MAG: LysR family transcriptional regulator [Burkholderiaceae bacterium]